MKNCYIGIDLGSTNTKAVLYDEAFQLLGIASRPVTYVRQGGIVEFELSKYCNDLVEMLTELLKDKDVNVKSIAFTGQAESLVVLDKLGKPMMHAISWMDERSINECASLSQLFSEEQVHEVTGQAAVSPTWPATKILWLKNNNPEVFASAKTYMLLKDYIVYYLTGKMLADMSIATFSLYFDIKHKCYWKEMLDAISITEASLPPLSEPCQVAGSLLPEIANAIGATTSTKVNIGTLDHFAGMIGTGNTGSDQMTLSMGTVMALAKMLDKGQNATSDMALHYGYLPNTYVLLPVAESGGVSLEWFRRTFMADVNYKQLNEVWEERTDISDVIFLPYINGTCAPEFDPRATGVFWGLRQEHDAFDAAKAVIEGVSFLLKKNCDHLKKNGIDCHEILAVGGGAKSPTWCQMWADITGLTIKIPKEQEAASLGAAMIAAIAEGAFASYKEAAEKTVSFSAVYHPVNTEKYANKYNRFCKLYEASVAIADL